jgi:predicted AAA+ superfamily ATPase
MAFPLEERIGEPELFTNRDKDLAYFEGWIGDIEKKAAIANAIVSHRKVGKTALLQRLYNLLFHRRGKVIPFYLEIEEKKRLLEEFSRIYYMTFISQLLSFKKQKWLGIFYAPEEAMEVSAELKLDYITEDLKRWQRYAEIGGSGSVLWTYTREAPHRIAEMSGDRILVIIDEFQHLNRYIYEAWPGVPELQLAELAGSYLGTSESKIAPMLITGSEVGMLMRLIYRQLPKRFEFYYLEKFQPQDFLELGYKLSALYDIPVTGECLVLAHRLLDGHPAYLRDIFRSKCPDKDLTTPQGLYETYLFEVGKPQGRIRAGWEEYLDAALEQINQINAKKIVLFLAKHYEREWTRQEIKEHCGLLNMNDQELERKLQALVAGDLIAQGRTSVDYQGLGDPTFDKVFRLKYEKEIEQTSFEITQRDMIAQFEQANLELKAQLAAKTAEASKLRGELNQKQGEIGELWVKSIIRNYSHRRRHFAPGVLGNNAEEIRLPRFREIEAYAFVSRGHEIKLDVLCQPAQADDWYLAVEVKNRSAKPASVEEVEKFAAELQALQEHLGSAKLHGLFYSFNCFQDLATAKLRELGIFHWDFETLHRLS